MKIQINLPGVGCDNTTSGKQYVIPESEVFNDPVQLANVEGTALVYINGIGSLNVSFIGTLEGVS
jgi:hypothetical protein